MDEHQKYALGVLTRAGDMLATARQGLDDVLGDDPSRRLTGLRNVIAFGRSVTFVLQNMNGHVPGFEEWYAPEQEQLRADPLMRFFVEARNMLEKQGKLNVTVRVRDVYLNPGDEKHWGRQPRGAASRFIGDQLGGSGWLVELPDGTTEKYYVNLPESVAKVSSHFVDLPESKHPELAGKTVQELSKMYIERLDALLDRARKRFLPPPPPPRALGRHLRLVK